MSLHELHPAGDSFHMYPKDMRILRPEPLVGNSRVARIVTDRLAVVVVLANGLCDSYPKDSRVNELKTASIATIVLGSIFLFLRIFARWFKTGRLWADDAYAIIAAVRETFARICSLTDNDQMLLMTVTTIILQMSLMGFGLHYWNVPTENGVEMLKLFYVCQMLYVTVQIFSKVAILALYTRLFPNTIKWFSRCVRGMTAFMVCIAQRGVLENGLTRDSTCTD